MRRPTAAATKPTKLTKITKKQFGFVIVVNFVIFVPLPWAVLEVSDER